MSLQSGAPPIVPEGWKFAAIGLDTNRVPEDFPATIEIEPQLWVCREPPFEVPGHWRDWLGTMRIESLEDADLWLFAMAHAEFPEVADHITVTLEDRVHEFYHALMIAADNIAHGPAIKVSGANVHGGARVTGTQDYPQAFRVLFGPLTDVTETVVADGARVLAGLRSLKQKGQYRRVWRIVRTFYGAAMLPDLGERIHQHIRCVEGFVFPRRGSTKADVINRSRVFVSSAYATDIAELFDIRSAVEHLHGPFRFLPGLPERNRHIRLLRRGIQAEGLARHALRRFLQTPGLWRFYADDQALGQFWDRSNEAGQRDQWGPLLDFDAVTRDFREDWITDEDLDLS